MRRVFLLGNPLKSPAQAGLEMLRRVIEGRAELVGVAMGLDGQPAVAARADRIIVVGGDGTLIGVARSLGRDQIPLVGVNVGKLGFLAEFSIDELQAQFDAAVIDDSLISRRAILHVSVKNGGSPQRTHLAVNDCVIQAGAPFRMINLGVAINGEQLTDVAGDGLIVCTPSGSTAHNLSAGGPIVFPDVDAIVLTPLCPHSLTHRPIVLERGVEIDVFAHATNEGTAAIIDGQVSCPLRPGDRVVIRRFEADFMVVRNPRYSRWHKLVTKLHWGRAPNYD